MYSVKYFFVLILFHLSFGLPQFNLYNTNLINEKNGTIQYNCLRLVTWTPGSNRYNNGPETDLMNYEIMSYCLNEYSPKIIIEKDKFTFYELFQRNITSEQLYLWSASIDLIENYQDYRNHMSTSNNSSFENEYFYNCTLPKFGPRCQYQLNFSFSKTSTLNDLIQQYYSTYEYNPTNFICYEHLQCSHGHDKICLDWSDICNGIIECIDNSLDEEHCWQLEINQCKENEYRCLNGQCIPQLFYRDDENIFDCLDGSDEIFKHQKQKSLCEKIPPKFRCEDQICRENSWTSSCSNQRTHLLLQTLFSNQKNFTISNCSLIIRCIFDPSVLESLICSNLYRQIKTFLDTCPEMLYIPNYPILFGDTYIAIRKHEINEIFQQNPYIYLHMCYDQYSLYDSSITREFNVDIQFENKHCFSHRHRYDVVSISSYIPKLYYQKILSELNNILRPYRISSKSMLINCNRSDFYQCRNSSKYILIDRFFDGSSDCPYSDDENMYTVETNSHLNDRLNKTHFYCQEKKKYISKRRINDNACDCQDFELSRCVDENVDEIDSSTMILFQTICDGFRELVPILINNRNETDETDCQQWECDNIYTHCDGIWNCPKGNDEIHCDPISRLMCSSTQHLCVSIYSYKLMCIDLNQVNDSHIDCIGGTDERIIGRFPPTAQDLIHFAYQFSCRNQTSQPAFLPLMLCNKQPMCKYEDDEKFCTTNQSSHPSFGICLAHNIQSSSRAERFLCDYLSPRIKKSFVSFKLHHNDLSEKKISENIKQSSLSTMKISSPSSDRFHCHRGLHLYTELTNHTICLCPASYYGDQCQYENQRVSLAIQFRAFSDSWQTQFAIILLLIDDSNDRIIHSYERLSYLYTLNCKTKYQLNLLYSTRPKDPMKNYSIHLDFYNKKETLTHRGSSLFPIPFSFLPVHRLAYIIDIPPNKNQEQQICFDSKCIHGKCIRYFNQNITFCQCQNGWSGRYCTKQYISNCSHDSLSIGITSLHQSICVCPLNKSGPRCILLNNKKCQLKQNTTCQNDGQCILNNPEIIFSEEYSCLCPKGYSGDRCEIIDNEFKLSFHSDINLSQEIFIHFIRIMNNSTHERLTTFQSIHLRDNMIKITWSYPFHIVFIELFLNKYYLLHVQNLYHLSQKIEKQIHPKDHCPHVNELFDPTFVQWHIRRVKSYHLFCQNQSLKLSCFYDDLQFCICYQFYEKNLANCFTFHHNMLFDCQGQSECENDGKCFQDQEQCATRSICMCPSCFFGSRCQLTTNGFGLSLDVILGYQIISHQTMTHQPFLIQFSLTITILFLFIGFLNGILSLITFLNQTVRDVGCGLYLLGSSITTLLITIMFGLKFFILLFSHMSLITNITFLKIQCYSLDFILRICLSMDQWLNACVAIERTITVIQSTSFNKKTSQKIARFTILILFILITVSYLPDPLHRKLIDEINSDNNNQNKIWCIIKYSSRLEIYNSFIHTFHLLTPFVINLISAIVLILRQTRQKSNLHKKQPYKQILRQTIKEHQHLLIAPLVLVFLSLPRIFLIFISKCMKSANDVWLLLTGYFISFIPPMLIFFIFILPSTFYKEILRKTIKKYRMNIRQWFGLI